MASTRAPRASLVGTPLTLSGSPTVATGSCGGTWRKPRPSPPGGPVASTGEPRASLLIPSGSPVVAAGSCGDTCRSPGLPTGRPAAPGESPGLPNGKPGHPTGSPVVAAGSCGHARRRHPPSPPEAPAVRTEDPAEPPAGSRQGPVNASGGRHSRDSCHNSRCQPGNRRPEIRDRICEPPISCYGSRSPVAGASPVASDRAFPCPESGPPIGRLRGPAVERPHCVPRACSHGLPRRLPAPRGSPPQPRHGHGAPVRTRPANPPRTPASCSRTGA
ncbi:hypothetical protein FHS38_003902 [Streptomyces netropsis]|uniref:Uncharacterized protein n=1 Tax=Streptomyces netropsis TaxID=55404 RepID=A0A7W7LDV8_STRNE|nr:hypothetical protein [Streptomyces netropsis]